MSDDTIRVSYTVISGGKTKDEIIEELRRAYAAALEELAAVKAELEDALRSLASWLSAGGYNAPTVDAKEFEAKIRWGVESALAQAERRGMAGYWLIRYEDADRSVEIFTSEEAARKRFKDIGALGWNAHLFARVETNVRDTLLAAAGAR